MTMGRFLNRGFRRLTTYGTFSKETAYEYEKVPRVRLGYKRWRNQGNGRRQGNHRLLRRLREESTRKPRAICGRGQVAAIPLFVRPAGIDSSGRASSQ